jgi:predicted aspartyl protease
LGPNEFQDVLGTLEIIDFNMSRFSTLFSALVALAATTSGFSQTHATSAQEILAGVRLATGGDKWNRFSECESTGEFKFAGYTGTYRAVANLRTGENVWRVQIPDTGVNQASGTEITQSWKQDDAGDIQLQVNEDPSHVDELYLTSHGYWRPNFGGAKVKVLEPASEQGQSWDRLQFQVPGGHGFTLWINRRTHLIERSDQESMRYLGDYRRVQGVLFPFSIRRISGEQEQMIILTRLTLRKKIEKEGFAIPFRKDYAMPQPGSVTVPAEDGMVFQATINGEGPFKLMLDTGSPNLITAGFARRLGLPLVPNSKKLSTSGGTLDLGTTQIESLAVGGLTLRNQPFLVIDSPWDESDPLVGVVGYEFLRRFAVKVDYEHKLLTVYDAPTFRYQGSGTGVPLLLRGISFEVNGTLDGQDGRFVLDTGNEAGFALEGEFVQQSDLIRRLGAHYHGYSGRSYAGPLPDAYYARVRSLRMGEAEVHDVIAYLSTVETAGADFSGNIGQSILKQFNVTFDAMRGRLFLERNSNWGKPGIFNRAGAFLGKGDQGETVMTVLPGSPAESAGLHVGDVITEIDQKPPEDLSEQPAFLQPEGTVVHLTAKREGVSHVLSLTLRDFL